jgi:hypothetical protein
VGVGSVEVESGIVEGGNCVGLGVNFAICASTLSAIYGQVCRVRCCCNGKAFDIAKNKIEENRR